MTKADRERAIKKLRYMIGEVSAYCGECKSMDEGAKEEIEVFNIAIQALEIEKETCDACCGGNQEEKAKLCQKSYLMGMKHKAEQQPCEDAVSREDLRDAISDLTYWHANQYGELRLGGAGKYATVYKTNDVERMADTLPPVTPIRPKGEWETGYTYPDGEYWKCSVCKELIRVRIPMHFCSNCGADMRGK